jgi:hypothetical protein
MSHPNNSSQIALIRQYIAEVETEVNTLKIFPRDKFRYAFDSIALEIVSKSFALAKACICLLDSGFPDEAYGLVRSLVECALSLRYLTQDRSHLDKRTDDFIKHELAEKQYWLFYALEQFSGKPQEQELKEYARELGIEPDKKLATRHWSGIRRGYAWEMISGDHELDGAAATEQHKSVTYAIDYHQTSSYVHCSQPSLNNYFPKEGTPYKVMPSSGDYGHSSQPVLFITLIYLHSAICYALYGLSVDRPKSINQLFQQTLGKMEPVNPTRTFKSCV